MITITETFGNNPELAEEGYKLYQLALSKAIIKIIKENKNASKKEENKQ